MNCSELKAAAHDYFLGTLPREGRERFDAHEAACPACAAFLAICREISCREVNEFLDDYVEDRLPPERRAVFERHLAICPDCTSYLESYRATLRLGAAAMRETELAEMPEALVQAILAARRVR